MFTTDDAMAMLLELRPSMTEPEKAKWYRLGSDKILQEVNRIKGETDDKNVTTSTVASKNKRTDKNSA